jgi:hypothetical protein
MKACRLQVAGSNDSRIGLTGIAMANKRVHLTAEEWKKLGAEYCAGVSTNQLSKRWGPSRPTIDDAAKKNGWQRDPELKAALAQQTKAKQQLHGDLQPSHDDKVAALDVLADDRSQLILAHKGQWRDMRRLREEAMLILAGKPTKILPEPKDVVDADGKVVEKAEHLTLTKRVNLAAKLIQTFEIDARALALTQEGERRAYGFDYRSQQEGDKQDEDGLRRRRELAGSVIRMIAQVKEMAAKANAPTPPTEPPAGPVIEGSAA